MKNGPYFLLGRESPGLYPNEKRIRWKLWLLILTPVKFHCGNDVEILTAIDSLANFPSLLPSTSIWGFFCLFEFHPIEIAKGLLKHILMGSFCFNSFCNWMHMLFAWHFKLLPTWINFQKCEWFIVFWFLTVSSSKTARF